MDRSWFEPNRYAVVSYIGLRRSIGVIGLTLPFVLAIGGMVIFHEGLLPSISTYYYSGMRGVFVGSLCAVGVFLLSYRFGRADTVLGVVAGCAAIGLALFPTAPEVGSTATERAVRVVHFTFAGVFFAALAVFSLFLFTRTEGAVTARKVLRNVVYRVCGWAIVVSLVLAVVADIVLDDDVQAELHPLFWLEALAIFAFGVSWFVKGEALFGDRVGEPARMDTTG